MTYEGNLCERHGQPDCPSPDCQPPVESEARCATCDGTGHHYTCTPGLPCEHPDHARGRSPVVPEEGNTSRMETIKTLYECNECGRISVDRTHESWCDDNARLATEFTEYEAVEARAPSTGEVREATRERIAKALWEHLAAPDEMPPAALNHLEEWCGELADAVLDALKGDE